jgi:hypothetical protein
MLVLALIVASFGFLAFAAEINIDWQRNTGDHGTSTINVGDTVNWVWGETFFHTVTSDQFDSGARQSGTYSITFTTPGLVPYHCDIHNFMKGVIEVIDDSATAAPSAPPSTEPTVAPTAALPTAASEPTPAPSSVPTNAPVTTAPTKSPTLLPTVNIPELLENELRDLPRVSSGSDAPAEWTFTLYVQPNRIHNDLVSFNTRSYCYDKDSARVCSFLGPTFELTPGDNFTLVLVNELGPNDAGDGMHRFCFELYLACVYDIPDFATDEHAMMNKMHRPNTTNIHTHGLHVDPNVDNVYRLAPPGGSWTYRYKIPISHAPGLHWYHAHVHGSTAMQLMGGLAGTLVVKPPALALQAGLSSISTTMLTPFDQNIPDSIRSAQSFLLVVTPIIFAQSTIGGEVSQGCGAEFTCDPYAQAPLCTGTVVCGLFSTLQS